MMVDTRLYHTHDKANQASHLKDLSNAGLSARARRSGSRAQLINPREIFYIRVPINPRQESTLRIILWPVPTSAFGNPDVFKRRGLDVGMPTTP